MTNASVHWCCFKVLGTLQYFAMRLKKVGVFDYRFHNVKSKHTFAGDLIKSIFL